MIRVTLGGRRTWVVKPNGREYGHLAIEILQALAQARADGADVFFVRPDLIVNPALFDLESDEVREVHPSRAMRTWLESRWRAADLAGRGRTMAAGAAGAVRLE
ncbi:MAG: hypothetical protein ACRD26_16125, partial [Vicinamibacterales bacterium]